MQRRAWMAVFWASATIAATLVVWVAIRAVGEDISQPEPAAVAAKVATTTASAPDGSATTLTTITSPGAVTTTTARRGSPTTTVPSPTTASASPTSSTTALRSTSTTMSTSSTTVASSSTRTFNGQGGSVTIRFYATAVELVLATPADGFTTQVDDSGPERVRVEFRSEDHTTRIEANAGDTTAQVVESGGGGG